MAKVQRALKELVNPFELMSLDQKKEMGLFLFYRRLQVHNSFALSLSFRVFRNYQDVWVIDALSALM